MGVRVKICGLTNIDDARFAVQAGADMLGFIFYPASPRHVTVEKAQSIINLLKVEFGEETPILIGVFVNDSAKVIESTMSLVGLDLAQLSGNEPPDVLAQLQGRAFKVIHPESLDDAVAQFDRYVPFAPTEHFFPEIMVDTYHPNLHGGTGQLGDSEIIKQIVALSDRTMVAGGLNPDNVADVVWKFQPFGVDVASGVEESKGKKDFTKVKSFIANAKGR